MPLDGALLRARLHGGRLYFQRTVAPGPGSDFTAWTDLLPAAGAGIALYAEGMQVLLLYADPDGVGLKVRESADGGASFGPPTPVAMAPGAIGWAAAALKPNGDALALFSSGAGVYWTRRAGGVWSSPALWPHSAASVTGLACHYGGDWNIAVAGAATSGDASVWTTVLGDGFGLPAGAWGPLREVTRASAGSGVTFRVPYLARPDTYRLTLVEEYAGVSPYSRPYYTYSPASADFDSGLWREPIPFAETSQSGLALAASAGSVWLSSPSGVWQAALQVAEADISSQIVEAAVDDRPFGGRFRLALRGEPTLSGTLLAALRVGAEVRLSPGYVTPAGREASDGPAYWVERIERRWSRGEGYVAIEGYDGWGLLNAWRARSQYVWAAGESNVFSILRFLAARAGLDFSSAGAGTSANDLYPAFTVHPGEAGTVAVRRLLAMIPDVIFFRGEFACLKEPAPQETASYAYGAGHPVLAGGYLEGQPAINRVQVFGQGVFAETFDWEGVAGSYDRLHQVVDRNVSMAAQAAARADTVLRQAAMGNLGGEITVPVNCGQELYDVIEITDAVAGLTGARRRVMGISLRYAAGPRPVYEQRLALGAT